MAEWTGGREGEGRGEEWRNKGRNGEERENVDFARIPAGDMCIVGLTFHSTHRSLYLSLRPKSETRRKPELLQTAFRPSSD